MLVPGRRLVAPWRNSDLIRRLPVAASRTCMLSVVPLNEPEQTNPPGIASTSIENAASRRTSLGIVSGTTGPAHQPEQTDQDDDGKEDQSTRKPVPRTCPGSIRLPTAAIRETCPRIAAATLAIPRRSPRGGRRRPGGPCDQQNDQAQHGGRAQRGADEVRQVTDRWKPATFTACATVNSALTSGMPLASPKPSSTEAV